MYDNLKQIGNLYVVKADNLKTFLEEASPSLILYFIIFDTHPHSTGLLVIFGYTATASTGCQSCRLQIGPIRQPLPRCPARKTSRTWTLTISMGKLWKCPGCSRRTVWRIGWIPENAVTTQHYPVAAVYAPLHHQQSISSTRWSFYWWGSYYCAQ